MVTITLADNGGACTLPTSTTANLQILGVSSGLATLVAAN